MKMESFENGFRGEVFHKHLVFCINRPKFLETVVLRR